MTLHDHINVVRDRLLQAGIAREEAALDAELLARAALGCDRATLLASLHDAAPDALQGRYGPLVARRLAREPIAYILGRHEFWGLEFEVGPAVLVPRPETESVVEEALNCVGGGLEPRATTDHRAEGEDVSAARGPLLIADVGTGSGCLAVSLARELRSARVVAIDVSRPALAVAARNARRHGVDPRISFVETDLLGGVNARFDMIVSNPPYVPASDRASLPSEVRDFEPMEALLGGTDGLDVIRRLLEQSETRLCTGGWLIFEFGFGQEDGVRLSVGDRQALSLVRIRADLQGIPRTALVQRT